VPIRVGQRHSESAHGGGGGGGAAEQKASVKVAIHSLNLSQQLESSGSQEGLYSYTHRLSVPQRSDRLILRLSASGAVYVAYPTWRKSRR
jgi:hypothetical protein